jgi:hypothetical protein
MREQMIPSEKVLVIAVRFLMKEWKLGRVWELLGSGTILTYALRAEHQRSVWRPGSAVHCK